MSETQYGIKYRLRLEDGSRISGQVVPFPNTKPHDISVFKAVREKEPKFDQANQVVVSVRPFPDEGVQSYPYAELDRQGVIYFCTELDKDK